MNVICINKELSVAISISLIFHLGVLFGVLPNFSAQSGQGGEEKLIVSFGTIELPAIVTQEREPPSLEEPPPDNDSFTTEPLPEEKKENCQPENPTPGAPKLTAGQIEDIKTRFLREVIAKIQKVKRYPESARRNNWEGTAKVEFVLSGDGKVNSVILITSSKYTVLDEEAVEMVKRAAPFPQIPKELGISELKLLLPIVFRLEK
jgi:protein TonB